MTGQDGPPPSEVILYQTEDHRTRIDLRLADGTARLTQAHTEEIERTLRTLPQSTSGSAE